MPFDPRVYMKLMFYTICAILICSYVFACVDCDLNKKSFADVQKIEWHNDNGTIQKSKKVKKSSEKILHSKIKSIQPEKTDGQYCFVKVIIKQRGDEIIKEEILECADGKKGIDTPGYWELFAQFYYRDVGTPEYCRYYSRKGHAFKTPGKVCLQVNGEWEVE